MEIKQKETTHSVSLNQEARAKMKIGHEILSPYTTVCLDGPFLETHSVKEWVSKRNVKHS